MKTLHVHIGTPKTGTTSIQNFCVDNEKLLEKQGYCYPLFPYSYKSVAKVRNGHFLFGMITDENGTRDKEKEAANYKGGMQKLHELFRTYDNIILSDEALQLYSETNQVISPSKNVEVACIPALQPLNDRIKENVYVLGSNAGMKMEQWGNTCLIVRNLLNGGTVEECMAEFDRLQEASLQ